MPDSDQLQPGVTGVEAIVPPVGTDLLTVQKHSGGKDEVGLTHFPTMFKAPQFDFNTFSKAPIKALPKKGPKKKASKEWYAQPKLLVKAYEGDADSFFVTPGLHKTQHKEKVIPLVPKAAKAPKGKAPKAPKLAPVFVDVYWNFSKAMSSRDRDAEQEHVDDFMHAYKISLQEAEDVLTTHILGNIFGPKPTEAAAKKMVLNTIKSKLTHPKLGNNQTKWAAKYDMLFRKTLIRDNKNWHTFHLDHRKEIKDIKGKVVKVSYEIIKGTTKIGVVKSAKIIKY